MYNYFVSFRIESVNTAEGTYDERYTSLEDNITNQSQGAAWKETTSFVIMKSDKSTTELCKTLAEGLSEKDDLLITFDPTDWSVAVFGNVADVSTLGTFFQKVRRVS